MSDTTPKSPRRLLCRRVDAAQAGRREEVDVRVRRERERDECAPVSGHLRDPVHAERLEHLLEKASRGESSEERERRDEARDDERKRCRQTPDAASRQIRAHDEPSERDADDERRDDDAECEQSGIPGEIERGRERRERAGALVGRQRSKCEVRDGNDCRERDESRRAHEQPRRAAAARRGRGRHARSHLR
jgi:hypothetical protein